MLLRAAVVAAVLLSLPTALAHTAVSSDDGQVRASIGLLNEPVSTYAVTGLDVCFSQNTTAPRPAVAVGNAGNFTATLHAPDGSRHTADLEIPFGQPNCLTFVDPLVLTQPGQYLVDLEGSINGTTFDVKGVKAGNPVLDRASITFPDGDVPSDTQLRDDVAALEARIAQLESANAEGDEEAFAPGVPAVLLLAGLVGLVAVLRRKE